MVGGALIGSAIQGERTHGYDTDGPIGIALGGLAGEILGVAFGERIANRSRGDLGAAVGTSAVVVGLGLVVLSTSHYQKQEASEGYVYVVFSAAQLLAVASMLRRTD
jgi:hypothetical protein